MMRRVVTKRSDRASVAAWPLPPPYIKNAELAKPTTERHLFSEWDISGAGEGRLAADEETFHFKRLHFCAFHLSRLYKRASKSPRAAKIQREYCKWIERYNLIRERLIQANLGLVYDLIGRSRFGSLDRDEMCSEGMMALLRAVDTFDPWRGYRFSTYACNAILRAFSRAALQDSKRRSKVAGPWDPEFETSDAPEVRRADQRVLFAERLQRILALDNGDL